MRSHKSLEDCCLYPSVAVSKTLQSVITVSYATQNQRLTCKIHPYSPISYATSITIGTTATTATAAARASIRSTYINRPRRKRPLRSISDLTSANSAHRDQSRTAFSFYVIPRQICAVEEYLGKLDFESESMMQSFMTFAGASSGGSISSQSVDVDSKCDSQVSSRVEQTPSHLSQFSLHLANFSNRIESKPDLTTGHVSERIGHKYSMGKVVGKGTYSVVRLATVKKVNMQTMQSHHHDEVNLHDYEYNNVMAVKCIKEKALSKKDAKALQREVRILRTLRHVNIVQMKDFYYDTTESMFYIVTEYCSGGELFDAIVAKTTAKRLSANNYTEDFVRKLVKKVAELIMYLHLQNITHRDLKPENILLTKPHKGGDFEPEKFKLADFGFAFQHPLTMEENDMRLKTVCGSPIYVAPEILIHHDNIESKHPDAMNGYRAKGVDIWSLGIVTYVLLCGYPPFVENSVAALDSNEKLFAKIKCGRFEFHSKHWKSVSREAKDLIQGMLNVDSSERLKIAEVLSHPWFSDREIETQNEKYLLPATAPLPVAISKTHLVGANVVSSHVNRWSNFKNALNKLKFMSVSDKRTIA